METAYTDCAKYSNVVFQFGTAPIKELSRLFFFFLFSSEIVRRRTARIVECHFVVLSVALSPSPPPPPPPPPALI